MECLGNLANAPSSRRRLRTRTSTRMETWCLSLSTDWGLSPKLSLSLLLVPAFPRLGSIRKRPSLVYSSCSSSSSRSVPRAVELALVRVPLKRSQCRLIRWRLHLEGTGVCPQIWKKGRHPSTSTGSGRSHGFGSFPQPGLRDRPLALVVVLVLECATTSS
jgi:hypothetical protein